MNASAGVARDNPAQQQQDWAACAERGAVALAKSVVDMYLVSMHLWPEGRAAWGCTW